VVTRREKFEEFGGLFAADGWVQQVAVYSIFILKIDQMCSVCCGTGLVPVEPVGL